jgi:mannosyltransferase OCH1-like enzyme
MEDNIQDNIPSRILPRDDILVKNKFKIITENFIDLHLVVYYLDENKCKIIIRRLDSIDGWNENLYLKLDQEIINIGSSINNNLILEITCNTKLEKLNIKNQEIPKIIVQTGYDNNYKNLLHKNSILSFLELNPDYEYRYYNNNDCREFIKNHFSEEVLIAYDSLIPGAYKADLFRYCFLHINGGCYFDCKMILRKSLSKIINNDDTLIVCNDNNDKQLYNAVILCVNNKFQDLINLCLKNIKEKNYEHTLYVTGPKLFYKALKKIPKNIKFTHNILDKYEQEHLNYVVTYKNNIILTKNYPDYYVNYINTTHYNNYFKKKEVYYNYLLTIENYLIYILNPPDDIKIETKHLFINLSINIHTYLEYKLLVINNITHKHYYQYIRFSNKKCSIDLGNIDGIEVHLIENIKNQLESVKLSKIPTHLEPREKYLIDNKYKYITPDFTDFHLVIYFINIHKCKVILRRLDSDINYDKNIKILIDDELIDIGKMENSCNFLEMNITTKTILKKKEYRTTKIPKIIVQTSNTENFSSIQHYNSIMTFIELNPDYTYKYFTDNLCREYIKNNYDANILEAYDLLNPGAFKADLFRYCYLNKEGGCFFDCKMILRKPLQDIIENNNLIVCQDRIPEAYYNAIILTTKNNFNKLISECANNILNRKYCGVLNITGPNIFYKELQKIDHLVLLNYINVSNNIKYLQDGVFIKDELILTNNYVNYSHDRYSNTPHYITQYNSGEVYFIKYGILDNIVIYFIGAGRNINITYKKNIVTINRYNNNKYLIKIIKDNTKVILMPIDFRSKKKIEILVD